MNVLIHVIYIYICVCVCVCVYVCMYVTCVCMYILIDGYVCIYIRVYMHVSMYTCVHIRLYVRMCVRSYICSYLWIYQWYNISLHRPTVFSSLLLHAIESYVYRNLWKRWPVHCYCRLRLLHGLAFWSLPAFTDDVVQLTFHVPLLHFSDHPKKIQ